jgi:hypothetical protein
MDQTPLAASRAIRAGNIEMGQKLKLDRNGNPYLTGTFEHQRDDGSVGKYVFKAFDRTFPNTGDRITPATEMWGKLRDTREEVLTGFFTKNKRGFVDFHVSEARTDAEHAAAVAAGDRKRKDAAAERD